MKIVTKRGFSVFWWWLRSEILLWFDRPLETSERPFGLWKHFKNHCFSGL